SPMQMKSTTRQLTLWIACFAILLNALAPSISHALAAVRGDAATWEICRADGTAIAVPDQAGLVVVGKTVSVAKKLFSTDGQSRMGAMEHCAYCLPHAGTFALLPPVVGGLGILDGHA